MFGPLNKRRMAVAVGLFMVGTMATACNGKPTDVVHAEASVEEVLFEHGKMPEGKDSLSTMTAMQAVDKIAQAECLVNRKNDDEYSEFTSFHKTSVAPLLEWYDIPAMSEYFSRSAAHREPKEGDIFAYYRIAFYQVVEMDGCELAYEK